VRGEAEHSPTRDDHDVLFAVAYAFLRDEHRLELARYSGALTDGVVPQSVVWRQALALLVDEVSLSWRLRNVLR
jgi:hypothetical protein